METQLKGLQYQNSEIFNGSINSNVKTYIDVALNTSINPFESKVNKYAETSGVKIQAIDKGIWVRFSSAGDVAKVNTDNNHFIEAGESQVFFIENGNRHIRIIEDAASARSVVTEL